MSAEPSVEGRAKQLGWVPKEQFRGAEEKWVDADEFVRRGEEILPIVQANNRELQDRLTKAEQENARLKEMFDNSQEAIEELKKHASEETARRVKEARADIVAELKAAKKAGDTDLEVDLQERLTELDKVSKEEGSKSTSAAASSTPAADPAEHPDFVSWKADNPWFDADVNRRDLATVIAHRLRREGNKQIGRAFFDKVTEEVEKAFGGGPSVRRPSKVEGASSPSGDSVTHAGGKKYADLPPEAKQACQRQAEKLVGKGRAFKDLPAWQAYYAEQYFQGEA